MSRLDQICTTLQLNSLARCPEKERTFVTFVKIYLPLLQYAICPATPPPLTHLQVNVVFCKLTTLYFCISRKKSETHLPTIKKFISRSPNLPKRQLSPENSLGKPRSSALNIPDEVAGPSIQLSRSLDDLEKDVR